MLYAGMGFAAYPVKRQSGWGAWPVQLALVHYCLNLTWAPIFFGLKRFGAAAYVNIALLTTLAACIPAFFQANRTAGLLLVPYLAWLGFATALNFEIWRLNPGVAGAAPADGASPSPGEGDEDELRWTPQQSLKLINDFKAKNPNE